MGPIEADAAQAALKTALDLSAIFTEFKPTDREWSQPLVTAFGGTGRSCDEPKLVWLCHDFGMNRMRLDVLVDQLYLEGLLEFFADLSARELLSWGLLQEPCKQLVQLNRVRRIERERSEAAALRSFGLSLAS